MPSTTAVRHLRVTLEANKQITNQLSYSLTVGSRTDPLLRRAVQSDGAMLASKLIKRSDSGISSISANSVHPKGTPSSMSYISLNGPADLTQDSGVLLAEVAENSLDKGDESEV